MVSDLLAYALLGFIFVVTGLRLFLEKPNKLVKLPTPSWSGLRKRSQDQ